MPNYRDYLQQVKSEIDEVDVTQARGLLDAPDRPLVVDVRELEECCDLDQRCCDLDHLGLVGERARQQRRGDRERRGRDAHHRHAEADADESRTPRPFARAFAHGGADPHRGRLRDTERAHEREAREVDRDLVRRGRATADASHEERDEREHPDLRHQLQAAAHALVCRGRMDTS